MAAIQQRSITELLTLLDEDPNNEDYNQQLIDRLADDDSLDKEYDEAASKLFPPQNGSELVFIAPPEVLSESDESLLTDSEPDAESSASEDEAYRRGPPTWSNCIGQQTCTPKEIRHPRSLQNIIDAVNAASSNKLTLRAVGSGHSFSNVAPVFNGNILLDPHGMDQELQIPQPLRSTGKFFAVESGITIRKLNDLLWSKKLALTNMGAYDGQTLAGAISTGTHGTGIKLGPIASSVRAIVLVTEDAKVYHIEPSNGISDPAKFDIPGRILKQDDTWFNTALVAIGSIGIIYSYILEIMDAYYLTETRNLSTWESEKRNLLKGAASPVLTDNRHYEVDINPYAINGQHACIVQYKGVAATNKRSGTRGIKNWLAGVAARFPAIAKMLVKYLNKRPGQSPIIINKALKTLAHRPWTDRSYKVLNIGAVDYVKAMAVELAYPVDENLVSSIDALLDIFQDDAKKNWYLAGPIALRFVAASDAYLAPQQGRLTCMVELDMLDGITTGTSLLRDVTKRAQASNPNVRVHWGLDLDTVNGESLSKLYPGFPKWQSVYTQLNKTGIFNSPLTDRLGLSVKTKQ